jgi:hypothetical protein
MAVKTRSSLVVAILVITIATFSCAEKTQLAASSQGQEVAEDTSQEPERLSAGAALRVSQEGSAPERAGQQIGVFFMPSWDAGSGKDARDVFWACLQGKEDCPFVKDTNIWGPKGRIYNAKYPYEGPYLDKKPHPSLKGFYRRNDPEVAKKQLEYMKSYGIDFFAYNWFYGRHYYYHRHYAPQAKMFYPEGWAIDAKRDGRVAVPGVEEWTEQLETLLKTNDQLPKEKRMKFALNWVDDGDDRWTNWLNLGSPENIKNKVNYPGEAPSKELFLKVHDKMTLLWIEKYFKRSDYLKDDTGRPILYFYFPHDTESRAAFYGVSLRELLDRSQKLAEGAGLPGIKFIAVTSGSMQRNELPYAMPTAWKAKDSKRPWLGGSYEKKMLFQDYVPRLKGMGFEGMTAYVYHSFYGQYNFSYRDMRDTYRKHWDQWGKYFQNDPNFEYQVPVAMGWNRKPAGGTWSQTSGFPSEPAKDEVISTKATFKEKLKDAKKASEQYPSSNGNTVMICCWNEYLEGNHIEPTVGHGFDYLEAIKEVFK